MQNLLNSSNDHSNSRESGNQALKNNDAGFICSIILLALALSAQSSLSFIRIEYGNKRTLAYAHIHLNYEWMFTDQISSHSDF